MIVAVTVLCLLAIAVVYLNPPAVQAAAGSTLKVVGQTEVRKQELEGETATL